MSIVQSILSRPSAAGVAADAIIHPVRGFIDEGTANDLRHHLITQIASGAGELERSWAATRYQIFNVERVLALSPRAQRIVEAVANERLAFSYNYSAIYPCDCELTPHRDRQGCEFNFLLYLGDASRAPGNTCIIELYTRTGWRVFRGRPGDAVVFEGRKTLHARRGPRPTCDFATTLLHYTPRGG